MRIAGTTSCQRALPKEPPSPLVGLRGGGAATNRAGGTIGAEEGLGVRGALSLNTNRRWPGHLSAPLIRLGLRPIHLLPPGEKGRRVQRFGWNRWHLPKEPPSPLEGEGVPKGRMRGAQCFRANCGSRSDLSAPLIRLFAAAKTHLLPQGKKGRTRLALGKGVMA